MKNIIKWAITTLFKDLADFQRSQVSYMGKLKDITIVNPLGFSCNAPEDSLVLLFSVQGQEENSAGIIIGTDERIRPLKKGEVCVYNPLTKSKIYFREDKSILIDSLATTDIVAVTSVNVTAPSVNIAGDLNVTGQINVNGKAVDGHVHTNPEGGNTGAF